MTLPLSCQAFSAHVTQDVSDSALSFSSQQCHHISSHDQQDVSDSIPFFSPAFSAHYRKWVTMLLFSAQYSCYISSLTNRKWVSVPFSGTTSHSMTTGSEWQCLFLYPTFHPIPWPIVCELQYPILPALPPHLIPWPTVCEWWCPFSVQQSHHISSHDQ